MVLFNLRGRWMMLCACMVFWWLQFPILSISGPAFRGPEGVPPGPGEGSEASGWLRRTVPVEGAQETLSQGAPIRQHLAPGQESSAAHLSGGGSEKVKETPGLVFRSQ